MVGVVIHWSLRIGLLLTGYQASLDQLTRLLNRSHQIMSSHDANQPVASSDWQSSPAVGAEFIGHVYPAGIFVDLSYVGGHVLANHASLDLTLVDQLQQVELRDHTYQTSGFVSDWQATDPVLQ